MTNGTKVFLATTPSGGLIHWFERDEQGGTFPACNVTRGFRGNGRSRTAYGAKNPTCAKCAALKVLSQKSCTAVIEAG